MTCLRLFLPLPQSSAEDSPMRLSLLFAITISLFVSAASSQTYSIRDLGSLSPLRLILGRRLPER